MLKQNRRPESDYYKNKEKIEQKALRTERDISRLYGVMPQDSTESSCEHLKYEPTRSFQPQERE
jgi:hypothetical protein